MHTLSSARRTYLASASAVECTTTVLMPSSRQALNAQCNFASVGDEDFPNMKVPELGSTKNDERLTVFDGLAVFRGKGLNDAVLVSFNFIEGFMASIMPITALSSRCRPPQ